MSTYLHWDEKNISDFSPKNVQHMYNTGYVFTRITKGTMQQTRSVRINLKNFELSSENRRILKKVESIELSEAPLPFEKYTWSIAKMAKDFYDIKFGDRVMSANKIRELLTDSTKSNFNTLLTYNEIGYAICFKTDSMMHYSYPFYDLTQASKDMGMGMMLKAIVFAKENGLSYLYLGSLQRPGDVYKLQFSGLEWFDGGEHGTQKWNTNIEKVKELLGKKNGTHMIPKRIHITGICGVATSALAIAFHKKGVKVSGGDKGFFPPVSTALEEAQVPFYAGWHPEKMISEEYGGTPDLVIIGTASGTQNPETLYAREHNIRILSDAEVRGEFFAKKSSIVCAGTWGKTSSTTLLAHIFTQCGLDPSYVIGGLPSAMDAAHLGDSELSVIEGDEYKSSPWDNRPKFAHMKATDLLLTSVSWDHADLYPTEASFFTVFNELITSLPTDAIISACIDHSGVQKILKETRRGAITYGKKDADYTYANVIQTKKGLSLTVTHKDQDYKIQSPLLGTFQAENITGCFALACEYAKKINGSENTTHLSPQKIADAISTFGGLKRRLEKRLDGDISTSGVTVIDDIAHSGEKANAVLSNIRDVYTGKIITIFEPNIGGRQRESIAKYDNAFKASDMVIIPRLTKLKIDILKPIEEQPIDGDALAAYISKTHTNSLYIPSDEELLNTLVKQTKKGDVIAFLGSHGFRGMIEAVIEKLK